MTKAKEILVVDDDRMSMVLLQHHLLELGYQTETLTDGEEALTLLGEQPDRFDVVILDRMMPDPDGIAITREMARREHLRQLPIVMVTGADSASEMKEGIDAGVFYYLTKPVKKELVQSVVGAAVRQKALRTSLSGDEEGTGAFRLLKGAKFSFASIQEAETLAGFIANVFPNPQAAVPGIAALLINAIEHGVCQIGFEEKGRLLHNGTLEEEIAKRIENATEKQAQAVVATKPDGFYLSVTDPGPGFHWKDYISLDMSRNASGHGRGIVQAKAKSFDKLVYQGSGNTVVGYVSNAGQIEW